MVIAPNSQFSNIKRNPEFINVTFNHMYFINLGCETNSDCKGEKLFCLYNDCKGRQLSKK